MKSRFSLVLAVVLALALWATPRVSAEEKTANGAGGNNAASLEAMLQQQEERVRALERLVAEQSRQLETMRAHMAAQGSQTQPGGGASPSTLAPATSMELERMSGELDAIAEASHEANVKLAKLEQETAANKKSTDTRLNRIGPFSYSGDIRLRYEPFVGGTLTTARHRTRFRLRFHALTRLTDEITGGFSLASGDLSDPISTNETFGSFMQRKAIGIDRAFVRYEPKWAPGLRLQGGKFEAPFYRTQLTLDDDTNVEGISQSYTAKINSPVLKQLSFVAFQLPIREASAAADTALFGGQFSSQWQLGSRLRFTGYGGFFDWRNADPIRAAQTAGTLAGSTNSNAASATRYASKFGILDVIGQFDVQTGMARWPLMLLFNFSTNTRACTNGLDPLVVPCNPRDRQGYWAEARIGQTREKGDLSFGYTFIRLEREAVLAAFNFSDLRAPTNLVTHRMGFGYVVARNVTANYTLLVGRRIAAGATPEPWLKRMQMDLSYRF
jgi:hypothetical protein